MLQRRLGVGSSTGSTTAWCSRGLQPLRHAGHTSGQASRVALLTSGTSPGRALHIAAAAPDPSPLQQLEVAVPRDQRPSNELQQLKQGQLYSWGTLPLGGYVQRLGLVFAFFFAVIAGPISYQTWDPFEQPLEWALSASVGSLVVVAIVVVRIYLGWSYVGDRLMSAAVEYEETGWYDGEVFVKPPEVLTRDRLLGMYEVQPVMSKLRSTLIGSGALLLTCAVLLAGLIRTGADADGMYGRSAARGPSRVTSDGIIFSKRVQDLNQLAGDDELAAEEAAAAVSWGTEDEPFTCFPNYAPAPVPTFATPPGPPPGPTPAPAPDASLSR